MGDLEAAKQQIDAAVAAQAEVLLDASHQIHANPELGYVEHFAHDLLTGVLERAGLEVERSAYGLETAFAARAGSSGPTIAVLAEYDALAGIGHACGHNIIATAAVGAGIAAAAVAEQLGGQVVVLGTPAEEGGGGKIQMAEAGAFADVDAALMVHPFGRDLTRFGAIAVQQLKVTYHGRAAHAAAAPEQGINALDAAVLGYLNVAALRQHIATHERIHGIFTDGGEAPNVVPERAATHWFIRSGTVAGLQALKPRVLAALEAGAAATGCTVEHEWQDPAFADIVDNEPMIERYVLNMARAGRTVREPGPGEGIIASTDMGNVSHVVPSIHPMIGVSPPEVAIHTQEFARCAVGPEGDAAVLDGARALAGTIADLWALPEVLDAARAGFRAARASGRATGRAVI